MPFGLKNAGATYQRAMNTIFHDMIGKQVEVYIDDVVVKSTMTTHLDDLKKAFVRMKTHQLKMNPLKCAFGVSAGNFLGFLVHQRGIEIDKNKAKAIIDAKPPVNKKELQRLLGQINFLRRFISNCAGKIKAFSPLLKLRAEEEFVWQDEQQKAFESIKVYLSKPPVLMPPKPNVSLKLYISASQDSIGSLLAQDRDKNCEQAVYYLSKLLTEVERRYTPIEKLCMALYYSCSKLKYYMLSVLVYLICKTDVIKYMLARPIIRGKIAKWSLELLEFHLQYVPQTAIKGQALADFLADHPCINIEPELQEAIKISFVSMKPWKLTFDGSRTDAAAGAGIVIKSPNGMLTKLSFQLDFACSNNQAEYEALIIGLKILLDMGAKDVDILGDSLLVINQLNGEYRCTSNTLVEYYEMAKELLDRFSDMTINFVPRHLNSEANELAQVASGLKIPKGVYERTITVAKFQDSSITNHSGSIKEILQIDIEENDWRFPIIQFLKDPTKPTDVKIKRRAVRYFLIADELRKKGVDELTFQCIGRNEAMRVMGEVHEGTCGAHQAGIKMRWLIRRYGYYWPTILKDCIEYAKGCHACQIHGPVQHVPAKELQSIIKPWPFRGWAMDIIGQIRPPSSKQHEYILVATDYFTKWVEAIPFSTITQTEVIRVIRENIIHRFGLPQTITTDQGSVFTGEEIKEFAKEYGFQIIHSTPYYAQANGQAEATNKSLKLNIEKMVDDNPRIWHDLLSEALWAYRTSLRSSTGTTPFELTYGHDAVLPMEINVRSLRYAQQNNLDGEQYRQLMLIELEELDEVRLLALDHLNVQKLKAAKSYNRHVRPKDFIEGELVWKAILPIGSKDPKLGKWSPNWEGPFKISRVMRGGAYYLKDIDGEIHDRPINGRYLKKYYPSIWEIEKNSSLMQEKE